MNANLMGVGYSKWWWHRYPALISAKISLSCCVAYYIHPNMPREHDTIDAGLKCRLSTSIQLRAIGLIRDTQTTLQTPANVLISQVSNQRITLWTKGSCIILLADQPPLKTTQILFGQNPIRWNHCCFALIWACCKTTHMNPWFTFDNAWTTSAEGTFG